jgi:hypothetical protein
LKWVTFSLESDQINCKMMLMVMVESASTMLVMSLIPQSTLRKKEKSEFVEQKKILQKIIDFPINLSIVSGRNSIFFVCQVLLNHICI